MSRAVAEALAPFRDAVGGCAVVVALPQGMQYAAKPDLLYAMLLLVSLMAFAIDERP